MLNLLPSISKDEDRDVQINSYNAQIKYYFGSVSVRVFSDEMSI